LFSAVCGSVGVRTPPLGRIGSGERVSVSFQQNTRRVLSYDVLRQQKTGVMTKGVDLRLDPAYNVERVTNTSLSSCANNGDGCRRECSARRRPPRLYFSHFATRMVYNTVDLYAVYAAIFVQNRVFAYPTCIRRPLTRESNAGGVGKKRTDTQTPHDGIGRACA